ncbi:hypothetical protein [Halanaerobium sp.]|jgi:hypothetical protein|uniref:hypothetical protein n=1 Tax=Halanaerobium sp. TaxID=1895664 RepID=UPI000DE70A0C|nr:hypothetical protein [Halanaerobium sp.]PUU87871.1 MAG: hypothetical protein CI949_3359 [Halanaerobium sp.]PUU91060.1 MAG: hypothetical protein CI947_1309 [Halanaerobium sp.]
MINGKEIAKLIRKSDNVIIEKFEDGSYNVTDTYVMVKLNEAEFGKFFAKYNSYKSTADIPFNFEGTISSAGANVFRENKLNTKTVTSQIGNAKYEAVITDFYKQNDSGDEVRIFKAGNDIGMFNREYDFLLDYGDKYKVKDNNNPLFILDNQEDVKAVIMPVLDRGEKPLKQMLQELVKDSYINSKSA